MDVLVTGFNASAYCDISSVHITSVDNKPVEVSQACAKALISMMNNKDYKVVQTILPSLSLKNSA